MVLPVLPLSFNSHVLSLTRKIPRANIEISSLHTASTSLPHSCFVVPPWKNNKLVKSKRFLLCTSIYTTEYGWIKSHSRAYWDYFKFMCSHLNWKFNITCVHSRSPVFILHSISSLFKTLKLPPCLYCHLVSLLTLSQKFAVVRERFHILAPSHPLTYQHLPPHALRFHPLL